MARGRPRKNGDRFPSGQLKRPTLKDLEIIEQMKANEQKMVVLAQPHRKGETSQLAASAIGRFVLKHNLARECYDAAEQWATTKRKWLSALKAPLPDKHIGTGNDITFEVVDAWKNSDFEAMQAMIRYGGTSGLLAITWMAFDNKDIAPNLKPICAIRSVLGLAVHMGKLPAHIVDNLPSLGNDT